MAVIDVFSICKSKPEPPAYDQSLQVPSSAPVIAVGLYVMRTWHENAPRIDMEGNLNNAMMKGS